MKNTIFKKKTFKIFFGLFIFIFLFALGTSFVLASADPLGFEYTDQLGLDNTNIDAVSLRDMVLNVVKYLLSFIGLIAVVVVMYAGYLWMVSGGDPARVDKAKKTLINAVIGLAIVISAFAIVLFVQSLILDGSSDSSGGGSGSTGQLSGGLGVSGNQVVESHYPDRNQTEVPRNTKIVVTFREAMNVGDLIDGTDLDPTNIAITLEPQKATGPYLSNFYATSTPDNKTFIFTQKGSEYLGSPSENLWYNVRLQSGLSTATGRPAFAMGQYYEWKFEVGTELDTTPPRIVSVVPKAGTEEARNVIVQINFSEAIDPSLASGAYNVAGDTFNNLVVTNITDSERIFGNFYVANGFRTVEFFTNETCGTNSCGDTVYCLPGDRAISVLVKAASLTTFDGGITDLAGNSLDGNDNGLIEGPDDDNYDWSFQTNDEIDLSAPRIISVLPSFEATNVNLSTRPMILFDKLLMAASVNKDSVLMAGDSAATTVFYSLYIFNDNDLLQSQIEIRHDEFFEDSTYRPECNSNVKDIYQNCFYPSGDSSCTPTEAFPYCCDGELSDTSCQIFVPAVCGNDTCELGECASVCVADCEDLCCGDGVCEESLGETISDCADCIPAAAAEIPEAP